MKCFKQSPLNKTVLVCFLGWGLVLLLFFFFVVVLMFGGVWGVGGEGVLFWQWGFFVVCFFKLVILWGFSLVILGENTPHLNGRTNIFYSLSCRT